MLRLYNFGFVFILLLASLLRVNPAFAQCNASLSVSPASTTICSGVSVPVTISVSESGVVYQLRNDADDTPLSGSVVGTGSDLIINSDPISADLTIKVYANNVTMPCDFDLTNKTNVTIASLPAITLTGQPTLSQTVCEGIGASFSVTATGTGVAYQWKKNGIDIGGATASTYSIPSTVTADGGTYTVVVSGSCNPSVTSNASVLNINEQPEITVQPAVTQTICVGQSVTFSVNAGVTTSPTYQWRKDGTNIGATSSSYTIASVVVGDVATYDVVIGGTCTPTMISTGSLLNVNIPPTSFASPQSICSGQTTNVALSNPNSVSGTTYNWIIQSSNNVTGASAGGGVGITSIAQALTSTDGVNSGTVTYQITASAAGCNGPPFAVTVTVSPIPNVAASNKTICSGTNPSILISNPNGVANTSFSWTIASSSNVTGASAGSGAMISQVLASSDGINSGFVNYTVIPSANGCSGSSINVRIDVNPVPSVTNTTTSLIQEICSDVALNFVPTSAVSGTTYTWISSVIGTLSGVSAGGSGNITDMPVNATNTSAVIIYTITPHNASCPGASVNYVVTVRPIPNASASGQSICSGQSTSMAITNPNLVTGTTYSWIVLGTSSNVSGTSVGSGNVISQLLTSTDGINNGAANYQVTPSANGCAGSPISVSAVIKPVTVITTSSTLLAPQICSGQALNFTPTATVTGTTYTWTSAISGPINPATATASGSGAMSDTPINTASVTGTVTYHITPHFNGCDGLSVDYVVSIKPLPSANASGVVICSGQTATINISSAPKNVSGTTFAWTTTTSGNISGSSSGNGSLISQQLNATNALVGTVDYAITPTASGCSGTPVTATATVNPKATVNAGADFAVCEPANFIVNGTIGGGATSGTWTIISGGGTISSSITSGTNVTATYTVSAADITGSVTLLLTTNDPDIGGPCSSVSDDLKINVNRKPSVTAAADYFVCEPDKINLTGTLSGSATAGSWSSVVTAGGTLSVSSITGLTVTATYDTLAADVGSVLTFRLTTNDPDGTGPCLAASDDLQVTINESAKVNAGIDFEVCEDKPVQLNGSYSGTTSSVAWSGGSGVTQFDDITLPNTIYHLTPADIAAGIITLNLTTNDPDGGGASGPCAAASDQVSIRINKLPMPLIFNLGTVYAENNSPVNLAGVPGGAGGVFTGSGILAGTSTFDPANASFGVITITYTFTDTKGCIGSATANTIVNPVTTVDFNVVGSTGALLINDVNGFPLVCANQGIVLLVGVPPHNDIKHQSPTGFAAISPELFPRLSYDPLSDQWRINTDDLPSGNYTLQYTYTNEFNATNTITKNIVVLSAPLAIIDAGNSCIDQQVQFTESSYMVDNGSGGYIKTWSWLYGEGSNGSSGSTNEPTYKYTSPGSYTVSLQVTTDQGCTNRATKIIIIGDPPKPDFAWSSYCQGDTTNFVNNSTYSFGKIITCAWDFDDGDVLSNAPITNPIPIGKHNGRTLGIWSDPLHIYSGFKTYNVKLTITTEAQCTADTIKSVNVLQSSAPLPTKAYNINFENGPGTWVEVSETGEDKNLVSWKFGTPSGNVINRASSGDKAWWTGGNLNSQLEQSTYYANEKSYVVGPCVDITALERPMISMDYWADTQIGFDGAVVQYSLDGGGSWQTIGDAEGGGINWYNSRTLLSAPGGQNNFAWSQMLTGWVNARYNLDHIPHSKRSKVVFRVAFASNNDNPSERVLEGFAFDNIYIGEKRRNVLIEHFTNEAYTTTSGADYLDNLYDRQTDSKEVTFKSKPDFTKIQYHLASPKTDPINKVNPNDPGTRALYYGIQQPPFTIMDGILGNYHNVIFNGQQAFITAKEVDQRALEDPLFSIQIDTLSANSTNLKADVMIKYIDTLNVLNTSVVVHVALIEGNVGGNRNVVRKLLPQSEGAFIAGPWTTSRSSEVVHLNYTLDVPIENPDNLYLAAFIQNKGDVINDKRIHQSEVVKVSRKVGPQIVGLPDDPSTAAIQDIRIYPNPANNFINFELDNKLHHDYTWQLVDQRGVIVLSGDLNRNLMIPQHVNISEVANGIYFVIVGTKNTAPIYRKLAVMKGN